MKELPYQLSEKKMYLLGFAVLLITAFFSKGYHHFDEHFQLLEFAALKLNINTLGNMPWEYGTQMRSGIQPFLVFILHRFLASIGVTNPFFIALILRLLSASLAMVCMVVLHRTFKNEVSAAGFKKWVLPLSFFLWFGVYNAVRFSSENWSAMMFILGLCLALSSNLAPYKKYAAVGLLMGFTFLLRFQMGFMVFGFMLWLLAIKKEHVAWLIYCGVFIVMAIAVGVMADKWLYGNWTLSCLNYFDQNILQNKVSGFGVAPWYYYFTQIFLQAIPPFSLVYIGGILLFVALKPKHVFTFCLVPFILIHCLIGHKEIRFLFPLIYFLPFVVVLAFEEAQKRWPMLVLKPILAKWAVLFFWLSNTALLVVVLFRPADSYIPLYEKIYHTYTQPMQLYFINDNPYHRVLDITFYKRASLQFTGIASVEHLPVNNGNYLFATTNAKLMDNLTTPHHIIYASMPEWVRLFNFNNWLDRTTIWYVYEVGEK